MGINRINAASALAALAISAIANGQQTPSGEEVETVVVTGVREALAKGLEKVYLGHDASGGRVGFALVATENGFQDPVTVMFGYDAAAHRLIAMKVISNKETPGLGDKIAKDSTFIGGFVNAEAPLAGVKKERGKSGPSDVVMITGATISSRAVIRIINNAIARWQPLMDAYREEPKP